MLGKVSLAGEKNQNIKVFVRCRPINEQERKARSQMCADVSEQRRTITVKSHHDKTFTYDGTFGKDSTQIDVYKTVVQPLISEVLHGYNCTVFAYGQTGTGKTYTMEGVRSQTLLSWQHDPHAGIVPRALHQIFSEVGDPDLTIIKVSFLELYNEELFDLLGSGESQTSKLKIFEDATAKGSVVVKGLEEVVVRDRQEVYSLMERGASRRQVAATLMNASSSRSHTIFTITVISKDTTDTGEGLMRTGKLNLVDLAGSENIGRSGAQDKRAREAGNINQSLLTLGRVITALVERTPHIPYRESKLTRLLQDSLGGRTKTSIIATISPAHVNIEETLSTLEYAYRAKNIMNRPEVNQKLCKEIVLKHMTDELEQLRRDLIACREKNGFYIDETNYRSMQSRLDMQSEELQKKADETSELTERIELLQTQIDSVNRMFEDTQKKLEIETEEKAKAKLRLKEVNWNYTSAKVMLKAQRQTEEKLQENTAKLITTADLAKSDAEKLHDKIQRQIEIEQHNSQVFNELTSLFCSSIDSTGRRVEDAFELLSKSCSLKEDAVKSLQEQGKLIQDTDCLLSILVNNHLQRKERLLRQLTKLGQQASETVTQLNKSSEQFANSIDSTVSRVTGSLCFDLMNQVQNSRESLSNDLGKISLLVTTHNESAVAMEGRMKEQLVSVDKKSIESAQKISEKTNRSKMIISDEHARLVEIMNTLDAMKRQVGTGMAKLDELSDVQEKITENANEMKTTVATHKTSCDEIVKTFLTGSLETTANISSKIEDMEKNMKDTTEKQQEIVRSCVDDVSKDLKKCQSTLNAGIDSAKSSMKALGGNTESTQKETESDSNATVKNFTLLSTNLLSVGNSVSETMLKLDNLKKDVTEILDARVKRYETTGSTPGRRNYEIPRTVARTQPANLLQEKLQKKLNSATLEERFALDEGHSILLDVTATPEMLDWEADEEDDEKENNILGALD